MDDGVGKVAAYALSHTGRPCTGGSNGIAVGQSRPPGSVGKLEVRRWPCPAFRRRLVTALPAFRGLARESTANHLVCAVGILPESLIMFAPAWVGTGGVVVVPGRIHPNVERMLVAMVYVRDVCKRV